MSITTTKQSENMQTSLYMINESVEQLTVLTMIKTMLEVIKIKHANIMDENTREQFPAIANEIILLAEQTQ